MESPSCKEMPVSIPLLCLDHGVGVTLLTRNALLELQVGFLVERLSADLLPKPQVIT